MKIQCHCKRGNVPCTLEPGLKAAAPSNTGPGSPPTPGVEVVGMPAAHRLVCADGVHLGPEHHRREDEEEQPLEAQQDEEDHRGGRREGTALCKGGDTWGSGRGRRPPPPALQDVGPPGGHTSLASRPQQGPPCPTPGCTAPRGAPLDRPCAQCLPHQPVMSVLQGRAQRPAHRRTQG